MLQQVYFYWVCRDKPEFDSFVDLLGEIANDAVLKPIFELNTYLTGEINLKDAATTNKGGFNQFAGRPNWNRIFKAVATEFKGQKVGVFFCGPNAMGSALSSACRKFTAIDSHGKGTQFKFNKETF